MVRSVAGNLPEQVKNNQSVNTAAGNGGQKMSQYSWFTVYVKGNRADGIGTDASTAECKYYKRNAGKNRTRHPAYHRLAASWYTRLSQYVL